MLYYSCAVTVIDVAIIIITMCSSSSVSDHEYLRDTILYYTGIPNSRIRRLLNDMTRKVSKIATMRPKTESSISHDKKKKRIIQKTRMPCARGVVRCTVKRIVYCYFFSHIQQNVDNIILLL
jgi:hypothetical protein